MSRSKVIEVARGELGVTEFPAGSNCVKYWPDYTGIGPSMQGQPWCVCFLWWCFWKAGESTAFFGGAQTASCGTLLRWYKEQGLTVPVEQVQVGDIVILDFSGRQKDTQHCGLVVDAYWHFDARYITTIEGNTSPSDGSQSNGGMVCEKRRFPYQIVAVCRPQYKLEQEIVDDVTGHWAEKAIRQCMEWGLLKGYPDGSFQPDKPVTRAELAVVLSRMEGKHD